MVRTPQLASKLRAVESVSPKKCLNYDDLCSNMLLFQARFLDLQIQQLAILKPVEVEKSYIPQKKSPITCRLKEGLSNEVSFVPEILWKDG